VTAIDINVKEEVIRTGDVVHLAATPKRGDGTAVRDAPLTWSYTYIPDDSLVAGGVKGRSGNHSVRSLRRELPRTLHDHRAIRAPRRREK
jgi:hypothetical protein